MLLFIKSYPFGTFAVPYFLIERPALFLAVGNTKYTYIYEYSSRNSSVEIGGFRGRSRYLGSLEKMFRQSAIKVSGLSGMWSRDIRPIYTVHQKTRQSRVNFRYPVYMFKAG